MSTAPAVPLIPTVDDLAVQLRKYVLEAQNQAFERHSRFRIAVSGGSLPATLAQALLKEGDAAPDFARWDVFFADERAVPLTHEDSNYRAVKEAWLDKIPVLRGLLGLITGRALTIYLLFPIAVAAVPLVVARRGLGTDTRTLVLVTVGLTVLGVLLFGWVEDLAARRPLGVYPRYRRKKRKAKSFDTRAVPVITT